jgi:hypothetical protein
MGAPLRIEPLLLKVTDLMRSGRAQIETKRQCAKMSSSRRQVPKKYQCELRGKEIQ